MGTILIIPGYRSWTNDEDDDDENDDEEKVSIGRKVAYDEKWSFIIIFTNIYEGEKKNCRPKNRERERKETLPNLKRTENDEKVNSFSWRWWRRWRRTKLKSILTLFPISNLY